MHLMRILIVDDEITSCSKLTAMLEAYGKCETACSGDEAIKKFLEACKSEEPYDLITMDIDMPGKSGLEVNEFIRAWETENAIPEEVKVKILVVTGMTDRKILANSCISGAENALVKPVCLEELSEALEAMGIVPQY
ncbi:MAG: response regulator [Candidatus Omnitrophica bacterium]|nr:response regulator [Candidatus Omnitrophota bacterium]